MTKALKTKTARRAAKPAKKRKAAPECPIRHLGHEQMKLIRTRGYVENKIKMAQGSEKADLEETLEFIGDAMIANREAASFLEPRCGEGAAFLVMCVHSDTWHMAGTNDAAARGRYERRIDRCLNSLLRYFRFKLNTKTDTVGGEYYMPWRWAPSAVLNSAKWSAGQDGAS